MAAEASRSAAPSADSYIGSLISLTSKCEIRYEGILYNINTEESSIGLRNVRSFGTEGRKKDGPQIPASDKIYEYILFRGSDIKDLQVKSSPPVQTTSIHHDPAIIQSHYSHPVSASASLPSIGSGTVADPSPLPAPSALPRATFQTGLPLYQPVGSLGSWGSSPPPPPPTANGSGLAMPMYWQGFYAPSGGLTHMQQPPLLRPSPGMPVPHSMQQPLQFSGVNASLPSGTPNLSELPPPLFPPASSTQSLPSSTLPSNLAPSQATVLAPETAPNLIPDKPPITALPATTLGANLPFVPPLASSHDSITSSQNLASVFSSKPKTVASPTLTYQTMAQSMPAVAGSSSSSQVETSVSLVTPGQLLQPGPSTLSSSQSPQTSHKNVEVKPQEMKVKPSRPEPVLRASAEAKEPILPLPKPIYQKQNGAASYPHHYNRGRGRGRGNWVGRGNGYVRPVTKFTEDFDFMAMNEKFNKDEVWGHLGKSKYQPREREGESKEEDEDDDNSGEDDNEPSKLDIKPVYVKDDFFDTLSSNTLDGGSQGGRARFSEQLKIDTETFGDFRLRPSRGGGGGRGPRGGGRGRGPYYGRGYGYVGRGRGHAVSSRAS